MRWLPVSEVEVGTQIAVTDLTTAGLPVRTTWVVSGVLRSQDTAPDPYAGWDDKTYQRFALVDSVEPGPNGTVRVRLHHGTAFDGEVVMRLDYRVLVA